MLVFPPSKLITVHVFIDNVIIGTAKNVKGPLYVLPWQPYQFSNGLHQITAVVKVGLYINTVQVEILARVQFILKIEYQILRRNNFSDLYQFHYKL